MPKAIHGFDVTSPIGVAIIIVVATAVGGMLYWFADRPLHTGARQLLHRLLKVPLRGTRHPVLKQPVMVTNEVPAHSVPIKQDAI